MQAKRLRCDRLLPFPLLLLRASCTAFAEVIYIDQAVPGPTHNRGSWDTVCLTTEEAVDAATPGVKAQDADGVCRVAPAADSVRETGGVQAHVQG